MANLKSSKKDIRRIEKRRAVNTQKKSTLRTYAKNLLKLIKEGKKEEATKLFSAFSSVIDKAAKKNLIHKKNADRNKSKMAAKLNLIGKAS